jgi:predicted phosphodiesterase
MRVAFLADMHGNAVAFRAALADVEEHGGADLIVSLGDVAQGGPQPRECVELLQELQCPCVYGNSDHFLVALDFGSEPVTEEQLATAHWSREQLGDDGLAFLQSFEPTVKVGRLLCCHATPSSNEGLILPASPHEEVERALAGVDADAVATGHVHLQWLRRIGRMLWFSVGSVGLVWEHREPLAEVPFEPFCEYTLVDDDELTLEFRRIRFDVEELIAAGRAGDFPGFERWAEMWKR